MPTFFVGLRKRVTMGSRVIDQALAEELAGVARGAGCELLNAEFHGSTLRVTLDKPEGVTLSDCETVSKQLSALLDLSDFGTSRYVLEVSSPGLDRQLYGPPDYERFCGRLVRVTFRSRATGAKRTIVGRLASFKPEQGGVIEVLEPTASEPLAIALADVQIARLEIEL